MLGRNSEMQEKLSATHSQDPSQGGLTTRNKTNFTTSPLAQKSGVGIHTGRISSVSVVPALEAGIHFHLQADNTHFDCPALWERLSGTTRTTALVLRGESRRKIQVAMIEHFMAAAHIWRLDKVTAQIESDIGQSDTVELPILDGSSLEWCTSLKATTLVPHEQPVWVITQQYDHKDGDRVISFSKTAHPETRYTFEGLFGKIHQKTSFAMNWVDPGNSQIKFLKEIAPARTFGFIQEIEALRARGLALGGSLDNALVIDGENFLNKGGQRIENELASHKLLDAVGDFALAGKPIIGCIDLKGSGHALHLSALRAALENGCLQPGFLMSDGRILAACSTNSP